MGVVGALSQLEGLVEFKLRVGVWVENIHDTFSAEPAVKESEGDGVEADDGITISETTENQQQQRERGKTGERRESNLDNALKNIALLRGMKIKKSPWVLELVAEEGGAEFGDAGDRV